MAVSFAAYLAVFTYLALPWERAFGWGEPASVFGWVSDMRLIVWILSWVGHALVTDPARLFDAPIFHPAPAQLTGCEHFASSQVVFAPVFWATGNGVLAANCTAFISYPLAALVMERFVRQLGGSGQAAWLSGLVFALGPLRVPANLQVLQYLNLYLPLVCIAMIRLRDRPDVGRAAVLGLVFGLGVFSSYYMAVMLAVTGGTFGLLALGRTSDGRLRFALLATAAAAASASLLLVFSRPYFRRPESLDVLRTAVAALGVTTTILWPRLPGWPTLLGGVSMLLATLGLIALRGGPAATRRLAHLGLAFSAVGGVLTLGSHLSVYGWRVPLPFALVERAGGIFFRAPLRFVVVMGFGLALLGAAGFDRWSFGLPRPVRVCLFVGVAIAVVLTRGLALSGPQIVPLVPPGIEPSVYRDIGHLVRDGGGGPLLELPAFDALGVRESAVMMQQTWHWVPLITGYSGYSPPHRAFLARTVTLLPRADALATLVDATHLRWLLLKPVGEWGSAEARSKFLHALEETGMTGGTTELYGWVLVRVVRAPAHPAWFLAIATGLSPGRTVLGTSLAPLAAPDAVAQLRTQEARVSPSAGRLSVEVDVRNAGAAPWPVSVPEGAASDYTVRLVARWYPGSDHDGPLPPPQEIALPHDVDPGESIAVIVDVPTPSLPGDYELDLRVQQVHGSAFDGPENHPLRLQIAILDSLLERAVPSRTSQQVGPGSRNQTCAAAPFSDRAAALATGTGR